MIRFTIDGIQETCEEDTSFLELAKKQLLSTKIQIVIRN